MTLLPEEETEEKEAVTRDVQIIRRFVADVALLAGAKILMVVASHRLVKTVREMNKINFPRQRNH